MLQPAELGGRRRNVAESNHSLRVFFNALELLPVLSRARDVKSTRESDLV